MQYIFRKYKMCMYLYSHNFNFSEIYTYMCIYIHNQYVQYTRIYYYVIINILPFTFMHLADAFIQSDLVHSGYTFVLSV